MYNFKKFDLIVDENSFAALTKIILEFKNILSIYIFSNNSLLILKIGVYIWQFPNNLADCEIQ